MTKASVSPARGASWSEWTTTPETAASAAQTHGEAGLLTECADGSMLGLATGVFDDVCSSHLIEHFTDPEPHVREIARVLSQDGTAFFLTPNEPADFENPYHVYLFTPESLREMLGRHFASVELWGLDGDEVVKTDFATRRATAEKFLRFDPLGLRHKLPRGAFVWLHATGRRIAYRYTNTGQTGGESGITEDQFSLTDSIDDATLVLFAVCRNPIRSS